MIEKGMKLHVITRRLFDGDLRRHFVGEVLGSTDHTVLLEGYVYVFVLGINEYVKKGGKRLRILSLTDATNIINVLPSETDIEKVVYRNEKSRLVVTDGKHFTLDVHEFGTLR